MSKIQYERLIQDCEEVKSYINFAKKNGNDKLVTNLKKKLTFIEQKISEISIAA